MITKLIEELLAEDERALKAARKRLARGSGGSLQIKRRGRSASFYHLLPADEEGKRKAVSVPRRNKRLLSTLCDKKYSEKLIPVLEKEIELLRAFLAKFDPEEKVLLRRNLPEEMEQYITPLIKTREEQIEDWTNERFDTNPYPLPNDSYRSKKGEYVRSRLELHVANLLYDLGIPYRYECAVYLEDGSVLYPDFTLLHPETLEVYWLELFGMMDDPDYAAANLKKIARYSQSEMFPNLIMVFDHKDAPFRTETIESILRNIFLNK